MKQHIERLRKLGACSEAIRFAKQYDTQQAAWEACERGDWLLWYAGAVSGGPRSQSRKTLVLAACACARLALQYVVNGETRPLVAIETAEAWAKGEGGVTLADVRNAANAAAYAAYAAYAAAYTAARKQCAAIVRTYYPSPPETQKHANVE